MNLQRFQSLFGQDDGSAEPEQMEWKKEQVVVGDVQVGTDLRVSTSSPKHSTTTATAPMEDVIMISDAETKPIPISQPKMQSPTMTAQVSSSPPKNTLSTPQIQSKVIQSLLSNRTPTAIVEDELVVPPDTPQELSRKEKELRSFLSATLSDTTNRYFTPKQCRYCREEGHVFRDCPEKQELCHLCKSNHDPMNCSLGNICFYCYKRGHVKQDCVDFKNRVPRRCEYCQTGGHLTMECTKVWRRYIKQKAEYHELNVWCYYCAAKGHYGDFCPSRTGYIPPTAFDFDRTDIDDINERARKASRKKFKSPKPRYSGGYH